MTTPPEHARPAPLRIVIADDHPIWRDALERDLTAAGCEVVGAAGDGAKAIRVCLATGPDVCLTDLQMPLASGADVAAALRDTATRVLVCSASGEQADVLAAVAAGASGYVTKSASLEELLEALHATARGEAVFTPGLAAAVLGELRSIGDDSPSRASKLSEREVEVLRLVAKGLTSREAGARLFLSHRTVENHIQRILHKLHLHNRAQLVRFALEEGIAE